MSDALTPPDDAAERAHCQQAYDNWPSTPRSDGVAVVDVVALLMHERAALRKELRRELRRVELQIEEAMDHLESALEGKGEP